MSTHGTPAPIVPPPAVAVRRIALVGGPNVGKSSLFAALTGQYVMVSNYPGTTVEVSRASLRLGETEAEVIDTPGIESFRALREEERVTRRFLLDHPPDVVVHVVPAPQLAHGLALTAQLMEAGLPVVLVLNMLDELSAAGGSVDTEALASRLGIPVCGTVATRGEGIPRLREILAKEVPPAVPPPIVYPPAVADFLATHADRLARLGLPPRAAGLLLLLSDPDVRARAETVDAGLSKSAAATRDAACPGDAGTAGCHGCFLASGAAAIHIGLARRAWATDIAAAALRGKPADAAPPRASADDLLLHPLGGFLVLAAVLYALFAVVGVFGAGMVVDWIEGHVFAEHLTPGVTSLVETLVPGAALRSLLTGTNGIWTLAVTYAVAIIVPVVGLFYLCFGILEDSGYLPRLGVLVHRFLARLGLGGQAAIPLILGLGCVTTATLATRALPSRRERLIAVLLMSLATPCAAQLGVVLAILSFSPWALAVWAGVVLLAFLGTGLAAGRTLPGPPPRLMTELPPLRWPSPRHIARKSAMRIGRYLLEVLPYFAAASVILWGLEWTGLLVGVETALRPLARLVGLPEEASRFLLFGFFRRDYGAAGLYDLASTGALNLRQLVVAAVLMTLFIPCLAQLMVLRKEFGTRTTAGIVAFVFVTAFAAAGLLNAGLAAYGL